jgi:alkylation response protein AidB-like acyl-CoA dehydrogenase
MDFQHTEERRMLADALNRFVTDEYGFNVRDHIAQSKEGFSRQKWQALADIGVLGALFPETEGGFGGAGFDILVTFEQLGRGLVVEPFLGSLMVGTALAAATGTSHAAALEAVVTGKALTAFAHDEPQSHYEPSHVTCLAVPADDGWELTGTKCVVRHAEQADFVLVSARTSGRDFDEDGISLFLVPRSALGLAMRGYATTDGGQAADLVLDRVKLARSALVGAEGQGFPILERAIGRGIVALCAEAVGAMDMARDATLDFLGTRKQFGVPIGSFQAIQHRMATMLLEIEQARSAATNAAAVLESPDRIAREQALSAAKFTIARVGVLVAEECIQMHGGIGMTWELPMAHYAKRLVMISHQYGDEDHHLERYIALGEHHRIH